MSSVDYNKVVDNRDYLFLNFLEQKKISLSIVEQIELTKQQLNESNTNKDTSNTNLGRSPYIKKGAKSKQPSPNAEAKFENNKAVSFSMTKNDPNDEELFLQEKFISKNSKHKGEEYLQNVIKKFTPFRDCLNILENQFKGFQEYNRSLENSLVDMNQFFKDFLQPLNHFIFLKSTKEKLSVEYEVYKKSIKDIMDLHKKLEYVEYTNQSQQPLQTNKKKQEAGNVLKVIGDKMLNSFANFESIHTNFDSINLKKVAESYLSIKKVQCSVKEKHCSIESKYLDELPKLKTNTHTSNLIDKFVYGNIQENEKGQYFQETLNETSRTFETIYDTLNCRLNTIKSDILRIDELFSSKSEQKEFLESKLQNLIKFSTEHENNTSRFNDEESSMWNETDSMRYKKLAEKAYQSKLANFDNKIVHLREQINCIEIDKHKVRKEKSEILNVLKEFLSSQNNVVSKVSGVYKNSETDISSFRNDIETNKKDFDAPISGHSSYLYKDLNVSLSRLPVNQSFRCALVEKMESGSQSRKTYKLLFSMDESNLMKQNLDEPSTSVNATIDEIEHVINLEVLDTKNSNQYVSSLDNHLNFINKTTSYRSISPEDLPTIDELKENERSYQRSLSKKNKRIEERKPSLEKYNSMASAKNQFSCRSQNQSNATYEKNNKSPYRKPSSNKHFEDNSMQINVESYRRSPYDNNNSVKLNVQFDKSRNDRKYETYKDVDDNRRAERDLKIELITNYPSNNKKKSRTKSQITKNTSKSRNRSKSHSNLNSPINTKSGTYNTRVLSRKQSDENLWVPTPKLVTQNEKFNYSILSQKDRTPTSTIANREFRTPKPVKKENLNKIKKTPQIKTKSVNKASKKVDYLSSTAEKYEVYNDSSMSHVFKKRTDKHCQHNDDKIASPQVKIGKKNTKRNPNDKSYTGYNNRRLQAIRKDMGMAYSRNFANTSSMIEERLIEDRLMQEMRDYNNIPNNNEKYSILNHDINTAKVREY